LALCLVETQFVGAADWFDACQGAEQIATLLMLNSGFSGLDIVIAAVYFLA